LNTNPEKRSSCALMAPASLAARLRFGAKSDERLQEGLEAEVRQRAAEEHRRLPPRPIVVQAE
jgi:hypothetical protein